MAAAATFRRGDVIARRYQVVTKSGETSLWVGYHGFDKNNQTSGEQKGIPEPDVLIKVVRAELLTEVAARTHLSRELQRVKGLQHPGMPRLIDVQPLDEMGTVVLIEPIQSGLSQGVLLRRMVTFRKNEGFPLAEVRQISAQLASALSYIHAQMMCHGDLRLESVLLRPDGAKLCDIGLGAALPRGPYIDAVRKAGESDLLAPEVRAGKQPDPRSDVFGLASLYRHLISLGVQASWDAFVHEKPAMGGVLLRGMHEDPTQRYSSIEALIADVEAVALTGAPIRKRLAQTPLAMAVAAGRLPAEELNRPVEEIVSESGRSRRNEVGAGMTPLSGGPTGKMSIGTIPPQLNSQASTRSGRLVSSSDSSSSRSRGDSASSSSRNEPLPASAVTGSNRITLPGRSKMVNAEPGETAQPSARAMNSPPDIAAVSSDLVPGLKSSSGSGKVRSEAVGDTTASYKGKRRSDTTTEPIAPPPPVEEPKPVRPSGTSAKKPAPSPAASEPPPPEPSGNSEAPSTASAQKRRPISSDGESLPKSAISSKQSPGSRTSPQPSGSSPRGITPMASQTSIPPNMLVTTRRALLGALALAAFVGALVAVLVLLLLRPLLVAPQPAPPHSELPVIPQPASSPTR